MQHIDYIRRCIQLAEKGKGWVNPNPMVGALLVYEGEIIAEGYHRAFGLPHAEVEAISQVQDPEILKKCTLYVSLEPCSHFGKTPPCADLICNAHIPSVVVAASDPNPLVSGRGLKKMEEAGIQVIHGLMEEESRRLNRFFEKFHRKKRPYILLKWAETADGFMAPWDAEERFISGEDSRVYSHALRQEVSAILVGVGTWEIDQPALTDRFHGGPQPIRLVWDPFLKGHYDHVSSDLQETWIINENTNHAHGALRFIAIEGIAKSIEPLWDFLYQRQINSVLIEGGAILFNHVFSTGIFDEIHRFVNPNLTWNQGKKAPVVKHLRPSHSQNFNESSLYVYEN
jgi:diaminohydroxyphosphoribosylaminopyrimidine deaminase/5-amino-6-(5-phosphoribosylamino)uracil reductase